MDRAGRGNNNADRGNAMQRRFAGLRRPIDSANIRIGLRPVRNMPDHMQAIMRGHEQDRARMAQRHVNNEVRANAMEQPAEARTSPITTVDTAISLQNFIDRMTSIGEYLLESDIIHVKKIVDEIAETDNHAPAA